MADDFASKKFSVNLFFFNNSLHSYSTLIFNARFFPETNKLVTR